jgi:Zn-dependent protease/CBS domain-containing protein
VEPRQRRSFGYTRRVGGSLRVARLLGVDINIHVSWLFIALLVTYMLAAVQFPFLYPGWSTAEYWAVAGVTAFLFFASVLAHELSHAVVARRMGLSVQRITLFIFGGAAELESEPARPRDEALIAVAGPATSLLIGGGLGLAYMVVSQPQLAALLGWLGFINVALAVFNLIPGYPMDGGRILRALIWRIRKDHLAATRNAALVGRLFGYGLVGWGIFWVIQLNLAGLWLALIGWFLATTASASVAQVSLEHSLRGVKVRDVMDDAPPSVSPNVRVADLVSDHLLRGEDRSFLVRHDDGGLAGIVTLTVVRRLARDEWDGARVTDIMTRYADLLTVTPEDDVELALRRIHERNVGQLPVVVETRDAVGLVTRASILRLIDTRLKLGV